MQIGFDAVHRAAVKRNWQGETASHWQIDSLN